jgi:DNA replication protein DnaC
MGEPASTNVSLLKELHADLGRKYKKHEAAIETLWRLFDATQRAACLRAGPAGTGKTCLALAIAGHFDLDVYIG